MRWLHGFLNYRYQLCTQLVQVYLIADGRIERSKCAGCVILATVEATVDQRARAIMQWLEQNPNQKGGSNNRQLVSLYECETACQGLECEHANFVDRCQQDRQGAVDQRAAYDDINVP